MMSFMQHDDFKFLIMQKVDGRRDGKAKEAEEVAFFLADVGQFANCA